MDNFKEEDFSSSTWMFVEQVTVQSRISIEGVTARSDDCQAFCVGNETTDVFQKGFLVQPLISSFLLLVA